MVNLCILESEIQELKLANKELKENVREMEAKLNK